MSTLSAKYQFCAIHAADNTDGKVTGGGEFFTAGRNLSRHRDRGCSGAGDGVRHSIYSSLLPS